MALHSYLQAGPLMVEPCTKCDRLVERILRCDQECLKRASDLQDARIEQNPDAVTAAEAVYQEAFRLRAQKRRELKEHRATHGEGAQGAVRI